MPTAPRALVALAAVTLGVAHWGRRDSSRLGERPDDPCNHNPKGNRHRDSGCNTKQRSLR